MSYQQFFVPLALLQLADSISLFLHFGWLAWLSISDGLSVFKRHSPLPFNRESRTFLSFGNLCFARLSRQELSTCYNAGPMNIEQVIDSLKQERNRIDQAIAVLNSGSTRGGWSLSGHRGPRHMSAAARARISAAQKARWAKVKGQKKKK